MDGEEEAMIVGTIQREDNCSWQDSKSWLEQDEEEEDGIYHVGTCQGASSLPPEAKEKQCSAIVCPPKEEDEDAEAIEDSWWTPEPEDLWIEGKEKDYFLELLIGDQHQPRELRRSRPRSATRQASWPRKGRPRGANQPPAKARGKAARRLPREEAV